ncbi:hypothetical protein MRX96_012932 [Rhipicephalus microplus]
MGKTKRDKKSASNDVIVVEATALLTSVCPAATATLRHMRAERPPETGVIENRGSIWLCLDLGAAPSSNGDCFSVWPQGVCARKRASHGGEISGTVSWEGSRWGSHRVARLLGSCSKDFTSIGVLGPTRSARQSL